MPIGSLLIRWEDPLEGVVAGYSLGIRELSVKSETSNILVVNWPQLSATTKSYTVPAGTIKVGGAYRLSVCATMSDGTKKWSDEIYFYGADCCGVRYDSILSFRIWTGFDLGIKNATYYSTLTWEPVLDKPFVNTYAYDQGVSSSQLNSYDSVNTVIPGYKMNSSTLMCAHVRSGTYIDEVDIEINMNLPWSYYGEADSFDAQAVMTHEMGHALGLVDKYDLFASEWTMYGLTATGETKKRSLHEVDIAALRGLYGNL